MKVESVSNVMHACRVNLAEGDVRIIFSFLAKGVTRGRQGLNVRIPLLEFHGTLDYGVGLGSSGIGVQPWGSTVGFHGTLD